MCILGICGRVWCLDFTNNKGYTVAANTNLLHTTDTLGNTFRVRYTSSASGFGLKLSMITTLAGVQWQSKAKLCIYLSVGPPIEMRESWFWRKRVSEYLFPRGCSKVVWTIITKFQVSYMHSPIRYTESINQRIWLASPIVSSKLNEPCSEKETINIVVQGPTRKALSTMSPL